MPTVHGSPLSKSNFQSLIVVFQLLNDRRRRLTRLLNIDRQTDTHTDIQTDRETDIQTDTHIHQHHISLKTHMYHSINSLSTRYVSWLGRTDVCCW